MKYLRALVISILLLGSSYVPFSHAYIYASYSNPVEWDYAINRETGEKGFEYSDYPIASFFSFRLDGTPDAQFPITTTLGDPDDGILDGYNPFISLATIYGSVTIHEPWIASYWAFAVSFVLSDTMYGTFTSEGGEGSCKCDELVLYIDDYQPRPWLDPYPLAVYFSNPTAIGWETFHVNYEASKVAEPGVFALLVIGLAALFMRRYKSLG